MAEQHNANGGVSALLRTASGSVTKNAAGGISTTNRDAAGRLVQVSTPQFGATQISYDDATGQVASQTDATGRRTVFLYDAVGKLTGVRDPSGALTRVEEPAPNHFRIISPQGHLIGIVTDPAGNLTALTDALGRATRFTWDSAGRLTSLSDPASGRFTYRYDAAGQLISRADALGAITRYAYDADGNLTSVIDALGHVTRFSYNAQDLPTLITDPLGRAERLTYDAGGRLTGTTDALGRVTSRRYDAAGHLVAQVDATGATTSYSYTATGAIASVTSPGSGTTVQRYDAAGRLASVISPTGAGTTYRYDAAGRQIAATSGTATTVYTYDALGRRTGQRTSSGASQTVDLSPDGTQQGVTANGTAAVRYTTDPAGEITAVATASGTVRYQYDASGRRVALIDPTGAVTRYQYDAAGHLLRLIDPLASATFRYNPVGLRVSATLPGGITAAYGYDAANHLTSLTYRRGSSILARFGYQYDADGNVVRQTENGAVQRFSYDRLNRLIAAVQNGQTLRYQYDANGNLLSGPNGGGWRYDAAGHLLEANGVHFTYNAAGLLVSSSDGSRYVYDGNGHLLSATVHGRVVRYSYDALGRVMTRAEGKDVTRYQYSGTTLIGIQQTRKGKLGPVQRLLLGPGLDESLAVGSNGLLTQVLLADRQGTIRLSVQSPSGKRVGQSYSPFGQVTGGGNGLPGFLGRITDPATGLVDLRDRLYDPLHARFLAPDPLAQAGNPLYSYAQDNPLTFSDPFGLCIGGHSSDDWATLGGEGLTAASGLAEGGLADGLGILGVGLAFAQAINCPSAANAAGLGVTTSLATLAILMPELGLALAVAGLAFAVLNARAGQKYSSYSDCGPGGPALDNPANGGSGDCDSPANNTDPTFLDNSEVAGTGTGAATTLAPPSPGSRVSFLFPVSQAGAATLTIYTSAGTIIHRQTAVRNVSSPSATFSWDGRDDGGHAARPGRYLALLHLAAGGGGETDVLRTAVLGQNTITPTPPITPIHAAISSLAAQITVPQEGTLVRGVLPITGVAAGRDFDHFSLDYGPGARPKTWTSIVTANPTAVADAGPVPLAQRHTLYGNLGTLDTGLSDYFYLTFSHDHGLGGLYTLRLQVFGKHGQVAETRSHFIVGRVATYVQDALIASPDGRATLAVPSLAIHTISQLFAILLTTPAPAPPSGLRALSPVYALHPAGYLFDTPATLRITIPSAPRGTAIYAWSAADSAWIPLPTSIGRGARVAILGAAILRNSQAPALYAAFVSQAAPPAPVLLTPAGGVAAGHGFSLAAVTRPGATVHLKAGGHPVSVAVADNQGLAVIGGITLRMGANRFTGTADDGAGHTSAPSAPITIVAGAPPSGRHGAGAPLVARASAAPPPPPVIDSSTHHAMLAGDFRQPAGRWPGGAAPLGAATSEVFDPTGGGHAALRITAGAGGDLTTFLPITAFDLRTHPEISFTYRVASTVQVDLAVHANGTWWVVPLSDLPPSAADFQTTYFAALYGNPVNLLKRDNRWHSISLNLYGLIREQVPTGQIMVDRMAVGDWMQGGWMAVQPSTANQPGAQVLLDQVVIPAISRRARASFTWANPDSTGISAYGYLLDHHPSTVPPTRSMGSSTHATFGPLASGQYWLHVRARNRAGVWGAAASYPIVIDGFAPLVGAPDPGPSGTGAAYVAVPLSDPGGSGIDASTLRFSAFGKVYGPAGGVVTYDPYTGSAIFTLSLIQPPPRNLFPGGKVPVALMAAEDAAGNQLPHRIPWTYTLDIPNGLPGGAQLLTTRGGDSPTLSPDSTTVAFVSTRSGSAHLWRIDAGDVGEKRGTARQLVNGPGIDANPAWSPDGKLIAFDSTRDGSRHLWLVHPDGSGLIRLTDGPAGDAQPAWSPDGKQLTFVNDGDLLVVNRNGSGRRVLIADGEHAVFEPAWSPNGKLIAFRHSLYVDQIWTVHADGSHAGPVTSLGDGEVQSAPTWLADGRIAYVSDRHKVSVIYTVDADGSSQGALIGQPPARLFAPTASRDGAVTAFVSTLTGPHNIYVSREFHLNPFDLSAPSFDVAAGGSVTLKYGLSSTASVMVDVTDSSGSQVRVLSSGHALAAGAYQARWDGRDSRGHALPEGIYTFRVVARAPGLAPLTRAGGISIDNLSLHGSLRVLVIRKGRPAAAVALTVLRGQAYVSTFYTDRDGTAAFSLIPGAYDVMAQSSQGEQGSARGLAITRHGTLQSTIAISAPPPAPNGGAPTATPAGGGVSSTPTTTSAASPTETAVSGTSTPTPVVPTATLVSGTATASPTLEVIPTAGDRSKGTLAIKVLTAPGLVAAEALVEVLRGSTSMATGFTDSQGIKTSVLPPGDYTIHATLGDASATSTGPARVIAGQIARVTLNMQAGILVLHVDSAPGKPAVEALVSLNRGQTTIADHFTDAQGNVTILAPHGEYQVRASLSDTLATLPGVTVTVGQTTHATLDMEAGTLTLTIYQSPGKVAVGALVSVSRQGTTVANHFSDSQGRVITLLPHGVYSAGVSLGDATATLAGTVSVPVGGAATGVIDLHAGTLLVQVRKASGGPVSDTLVTITRGGTSVGIHATDSKGVVSFLAAQGAYTIQLQTSAGKTITSSATIVEGVSRSVTVTVPG
jgi:RHS repeat-associated protein